MSRAVARWSQEKGRKNYVRLIRYNVTLACHCNIVTLCRRALRHTVQSFQLPDSFSTT
jgi:hypothetical protein